MHARPACATFAARAALAWLASAAVAHCLQAAIVDASGAAVCSLDCADFVRASKSRAADGAPSVALGLAPAAGERVRQANADAERRGLAANLHLGRRAAGVQPERA